MKLGFAKKLDEDTCLLLLAINSQPQKWVSLPRCNHSALARLKRWSWAFTMSRFEPGQEGRAPSVMLTPIGKAMAEKVKTLYGG